MAVGGADKKQTVLLFERRTPGAIANGRGVGLHLGGGTAFPPAEIEPL